MQWNFKMLCNFTVRRMTASDIDLAYLIEQENYEFPWYQADCHDPVNNARSAGTPPR